MAKHYHVLGGPSVGKGLSAKRLREVYQDDVWFVTVGELVKNRRKIDPNFENRYGKTIDDGLLVPNEEINPMVIAHYNEGLHHGHEFFYFDGWGRNPGQVYVAKNLGTLNPGNAKVGILRGSKEICQQRNLHRRNLQPDGARIDDTKDGVFNTRWTIFAQNIKCVRKAIINHGVQVRWIDACQDLNVVKEQVLEHVLTLRPVQGEIAQTQIHV